MSWKQSFPQVSPVPLMSGYYFFILIQGLGQEYLKTLVMYSLLLPGYFRVPYSKLVFPATVQCQLKNFCSQSSDTGSQL